MEFQQIIELIKTVSSSNLSSFEFEQGETYLKMKTQKDKGIQKSQPVPAANQIQLVEEIKVLNDTDGEIQGSVVKSPLVGTFYAAPSPEAEEFVHVGDKITVGQTLGIIEAMKLMNEIESEYNGTVVEILVRNQEMVEYGQPLFIIKEA